MYWLALLIYGQMVDVSALPMSGAECAARHQAATARVRPFEWRGWRVETTDVRYRCLKSDTRPVVAAFEGMRS